MDEDLELDALLVLAEAPGKKEVNDVIEASYRMRHGVSSGVVEKTATALGIDSQQASAVFTQSVPLVRRALYKCESKEDVAALFPSDFHSNLKALLSSVIATKIPSWKEASVRSQVSLPKLVDSDYRIDIKSSSNHIARMAVPTVLVDLKVQETPTSSNQVPGESNVVFELNKETLDTMLSGLGRIRDQLNSIA
eukprot:GFYU01015471.1.p1 GENE.GFYU01015471.1~~GFYU01015471.1.p1  ORF type:complete len:203 (+),score=55.02 GFYU01015471.1:28-609(+)